MLTNIGTSPVEQRIDGAVASRPPKSNLVTGEADGDLQIAFGLVHPTRPIAYQVDDPYYEKHGLSLFNTFLDAVSWTLHSRPTFVGTAAEVQII
jgi:hypothetical protein